MAETSDPETREHRRPRSEAHPLSWDALTTTQQGALKQLWDLLRGLLDDAKKHGRRAASERDSKIADLLPPIRATRLNQVTLIDGARGSGKTVVLVTLLNSLNQAARGETPELSAEQLLAIDAGHVIPIALLDLRSLPSQTSLQVHFAGVLRRVAKLVGFASFPDDCPPPTAPYASEVQRGQRAWANFYKAVATTEVRLSRRSAEVDPETFAAEAHAAEHDRLDLDELFRELVDELVEGFVKLRKSECKSEERPLFLVAIDDADMNPGRLIECLELIERFEHPNLAFVLSGDSELFEATLRANFLAELRKPLRGLPELNDEDRLVLRDLDETRKLAARYYEKIVPPNQRCLLPALSGAERLEFCGDEDDQGPSIRELLDEFELDNEPIGELMMRVPMLAEALPDRLRQLVDLRPRLIELARELRIGQTSRLLGGEPTWPITLDLLALLLEFGPPELADVPKLLTRQTPLGGETQARLSLHWLTWVYSGTTLFRGLERDGDAFVLRLRNVESLHPRRKRPEETPPGLEQPQVRALLLFASLLADFIHDQFESPGYGTSVPQPPILPVIVAAGQRDDAGFAWPLPKLSLRESLVFVDSWVGRLQHAQQPDDGAPVPGIDVDELARGYVEAILEAVEGRRSSSDEPSSWRELAKRSVELSRSFFTHDLLLLGAPETCLPPEIREQVLTAWRKELGPELFAQALDAVRESHEERSDDSESTPPAVDPKDPWWSLTTGRLIEELRRVLRDTPVPREPGQPRYSWQPDNLAEYVPEVMWSALFEHPRGIHHFLSELEQWPSIQQAIASFAPHTQWNGSQFMVDETVGLWGRHWSTPEPGGLSGVSIATADAVLRRPQSWAPPVTALASLLAHDLRFDTQRDGHFPVSSWPLLRSLAPEDQSYRTPWPAVGWSAHADLTRCGTAWNRIREQAPPRGELLSETARWFIESQRLIARSRELPDLQAPPPSWPQLFEAASAVLEDEHVGAQHPRIRDGYGVWLGRLHEFANPNAGLPPADAAALLVAALHSQPVPTVRFDRFAASLQDQPYLHWCRVAQRGVAKVEVAHRLAAEHKATHPELFALPAERLETLERLRAAFDELGLSAYLTHDLEQLLRWSPTPALERLLARLSAENAPEPALAKAWEEFGPIADRRVVWSGGHFSTRGSLLAERSEAVGSRHETRIPTLEVTYYRGGITLYDPWLAPGEVAFALAHDHAQTLTPRGEPAPLRWPLALYTVEADQKLASAWPMVQWPLRRDIYQQIDAWHAALSLIGHRAGILPSLVRRFIAATSEIYVDKIPGEGSPGSWNDVLSRAWRVREPDKAALRCQAYAAWTGQLPRFALPRTGLSNKDAADILVRLWDVSDHVDPRPELVGRILDIRESSPTLPEEFIPEDHPAVLVAEASDAELETVINQLRERYELG